jgi:hypothetical protein
VSEVIALPASQSVRDEYRSTGSPLWQSITRMGTWLLSAHVRAKYRAELRLSNDASLFRLSVASGRTK